MKKCISCRKPIVGNPGRVLEGRIVKRWCATGTYTTKTRFECSPCWEAFKKWNEEARKRSEAKCEALYSKALTAAKKREATQ